MKTAKIQNDKSIYLRRLVNKAKGRKVRGLTLWMENGGSFHPDSVIERGDTLELFGRYTTDGINGCDGVNAVVSKTNWTIEVTFNSEKLTRESKPNWVKRVILWVKGN